MMMRRQLAAALTGIIAGNTVLFAHAAATTETQSQMTADRYMILIWQVFLLLGQMKVLRKFRFQKQHRLNLRIFLRVLWKQKSLRTICL